MGRETQLNDGRDFIHKDQQAGWKQSLSKEPSCPSPWTLSLFLWRQIYSIMAHLVYVSRGVEKMVRCTQSLKGCVLGLISSSKKIVLFTWVLFSSKCCKVLCNSKEKKANDKYLRFPFRLCKTKALFSDGSCWVTSGTSAPVFTLFLRTQICLWEHPSTTQTIWPVRVSPALHFF